MTMYVLTGVHGSHVLVGLIGLMATLILGSSTGMYKGSTGPLQSGTGCVEVDEAVDA